MSNNRIFYGCKAVNIYNSSLVLSGLNGFVSGVQSVSTATTSNPIELYDFYGLDNIDLKGVESVEFSMERVISKEGDFFVKKNTQIFNELFKDNSRCKTHKIALILGSDDEPFVKEEKILGVYYYPELCLNSIEYNIGIRAPSITERLRFDGRRVLQDIRDEEMVLLNAPESRKMFNRTDYFDHKHPNNPSLLPALVEDLLEKGGLQDVNISIGIPYTNIIDTGTWNVNNPFKHRYVTIPVTVETRFTINLREPLEHIIPSTVPENENIQIEYGNFSFILGPKNRISSIEYGGGDVNGSIDQINLTYINRNVFRINQRE